MSIIGIIVIIFAGISVLIAIGGLVLEIYWERKGIL